MKVFISHKQEDEGKALGIARHLKTYHSIDSYLDVIDPLIGKYDGPALADHVQKQMQTCDSLLVVASLSTVNSQWVPWEIGIATEKGFPLATFTSTPVLLPEFLQKWPYLRSNEELDKYARALNGLVGRTRSTLLGKSYAAESIDEVLRSTTKDFYRNLKADLGR